MLVIFLLPLLPQLCLALSIRVVVKLQYVLLLVDLVVKALELLYDSFPSCPQADQSFLGLISSSVVALFGVAILQVAPLLDGLPEGFREFVPELRPHLVSVWGRHDVHAHAGSLCARPRAGQWTRSPSKSW